MDKVKIVTLLAVATMIVVLIPATAGIYKEPIFKKATEKTATLFLAPLSNRGTDLTVNIILDPGGQAVNAVGTIVYFPADKLAIDRIDETDSACEFFMDEEFNNASGTLKFSCGTPTPGIEKKSELAQIIFKKKKSGWATLNFDTETMVLANDGYSTNILKMLRGQKILISK